MARKETLELMEQAIKQVFDKKNKESVNNNISVKTAIVIAYDKERCIATISLIEDPDNNEYELYNKTGEVLEENDTVKVYYTTNVAKGWIGMKCGAPAIEEENSPYISAKVTNKSNLTYDKIDRNVLSVDFTVDDNDSDVVFSANQLCDVSIGGDLTTYYKVDGATQEFKPIETLDKGKRVVTYVYPMTLSVGNHNFSVFLLSENGGRGNIKMGGLVGALSGQISGLRDVVPPNNNLLIYLNDVPAGTTITLPQIYYSKSTTKTVDWGDGSDIEDSIDKDEVSHTYENSGNYIITIKCSNTYFSEGVQSNTAYKSYISAIYFPDNTTEISWGSVLEGCTNLETIFLGKSLKKIYLKCNREKLSTLLFPETTESIKMNLGGTSISSIVIPKNVTALGGSYIPFYSMKYLTNVTFENSVLGKCYYCDNLETVVINDKITTIPGYMFNGCPKLVNFNFHQGITSIGGYAFWKTAIKSFPLLPKITSISMYTFYGCTSLETVELSDNITSIGMAAFQECSSLKSINLPKNLVSIDSRAFYKSSVTFTASDFPSTLRSVGGEAFWQSSIRGVKMMSNCSHGSNAYKECTSLSELIIEDGVSEISEGCFYGCTGLKSVHIPSSVKTINRNAFYNNINMTSLQLEEGIESISGSAFRYCRSLKSVTIPSSATEFYEYIFSECTSLTDVVFSIGKKSTGKYMFQGCTALENVDLGSVSQISDNCFNGCSSLTEIELPPNVIIGQGAFAYTGIKEINLLDKLALLSEGTTDYGGIYNIGKSAFYRCSSLTKVDGYKYKFNVGLQKTERFRGSASEKWGDPVVTDLGFMSDAQGIYDVMGATTDSVFGSTGLKETSYYLVEHPEYANVSTDTYRCEYSTYHYVAT